MPLKHLRCLALCLASAALAQPHPQYGIKEELPRVGSHIRMRVAESPGIAVNLAYHQLPAADRAKLHAQYEQIAEGDEPPYPLRGLQALLDPMRQAQAKLLVRGELFLVATVGPDGKAREVRALGSPSPEMTRFAAQVMMLTPYKPAVCGGQPCTMDFPFRMTFRIE